MNHNEETHTDPMEADLLKLAQDVDSGRIGEDEVPDVTGGRIAGETPAPKTDDKETPVTEPKAEGRRQKDEGEAPDPTEADMLAKAEAEDAGETEEKQPAKNEEPSAESDKVKTQDQEKDEDLEGKGKELSDEEKRKGAERFDRNWKQFQEEKETFQREREAWLRKQKAQEELLDYREQRVKVEKPLTAEEYEAAAEKFEAEGKADYAAEARKEAARLRANPPAAPKFLEPEMDPDSTVFRDLQQQELDKLREAHPELRDKSSPLWNRTTELVAQYPVSLKIPQGIAIAGQMAQLQLENQRLSAKVKEQDTEIQRLTKATTPAGHGPTRQPAAPSDGPLTEAGLKAAAAAADAAGYGPTGV